MKTFKEIRIKAGKEFNEFLDYLPSPYKFDITPESEATIFPEEWAIKLIESKLERETQDTIDAILANVSKEFQNMDAWEVTCLESKERILDLFNENGIPEEMYKPWMCNNVLPAISLK